MGDNVQKKLLLHPNFERTIKDIGRLNILLPSNPSSSEIDYQLYNFPPKGILVQNIEEMKAYNLDAKNGERLVNEKIPIACYDESIYKFNSLEGIAYFTSHSLLTVDVDYIPTNLLTFYFYTRSKPITAQSDFIKFSIDPEMDSKKDCIKDKINFLLDYVPENYVLFVDGPLIGGDVYTYMIHAAKRFLQKNIIVIFFVKNSTSNLVTDNTKELKNNFNSDMHWAYKFLRPGQRTSFFKYADAKNRKNAKMFCYLKAFNLSPQRVEFHVDTFVKHRKMISSLMDLIYYLILVQGDLKNPQVRPIAIAELYARKTLQLVNVNRLMKESGIMPTMNQERFGM